MTDFTLLTVVVLTAIALVTAALLIARLAAPRTFNPQKGSHTSAACPRGGKLGSSSMPVITCMPSCS